MLIYVEPQNDLNTLLKVFRRLSGTQFRLPRYRYRSSKDGLAGAIRPGGTATHSSALTTTSLQTMYTCTQTSEDVSAVFTHFWGGFVRRVGG